MKNLPRHDPRKIQDLASKSGMVSSSGSVSHEDNTAKEQAWHEVRTKDGFALDFIGTSAILEWLASEKAIVISDSHEGRYGRYRRFSKLTDINSTIGQLVLFDRVYLNVGTFYEANMDVSTLNRYGIFSDFPRPKSPRFMKTYELIRPHAARTLASMLQETLNCRYEELWNPGANEIRDLLNGFDGLAAWLYDEFAKDSCGLPSNDGALMSSIKEEIFFEMVDLVEYATGAQGQAGESGLSYFSSLLRRGQAGIAQDDIMTRFSQRDDLFALYQVATSNALGFIPTLTTFSDVLRLREDKRVVKIRNLLYQYRHAVSAEDHEIVAELEKAILAAKKEASTLNFVEHSAYVIVAKILSRAPLLGSIVGLVGDAIELIHRFRTHKSGWIYFGVK